MQRPKVGPPRNVDRCRDRPSQRHVVGAWSGRTCSTNPASPRTSLQGLARHERAVRQWRVCRHLGVRIPSWADSPKGVSVTIRPVTQTRLTTTDGTQLPERLLNVNQLADLLQVNVRHIRRLVHERRVPFIKWGHLVRFDPGAIERWLNENRQPHANGP